MDNEKVTEDMSERALDWLEKRLDRIESKIDALPCKNHGETLAGLSEWRDQHDKTHGKTWAKGHNIFMVIISLGMLALTTVVVLGKLWK